MDKKEIDRSYKDRLEQLYLLAVQKKEAGTAMVILDKIRLIDLHMFRPVEDENDTPF